MSRSAIRHALVGLALSVLAIGVLFAIYFLEVRRGGYQPVYLGSEPSVTWADCTGSRRLVGFNGPNGMFIRVWGPPVGSDEMVVKVTLFASGDGRIEMTASTVTVTNLGTGAESEVAIIHTGQRSAPLQQSLSLRIPLGPVTGSVYRITLPAYSQATINWAPGDIELRPVPDSIRVLPLNC